MRATAASGQAQDPPTESRREESRQLRELGRRLTASTSISAPGC
jgi:hypothetical protein